ncbi:MAG: hypothetical protein E5V90_32720, partial [Mesorhizobium sp.]
MSFDVGAAPSSGRFAATFSPWGEKRLAPAPTVSSPLGEWSAERSGGWVRGRPPWLAPPFAIPTP